jgi:hypothetical protein
MSIKLENIYNQLLLFENYHLNLYNISFTDESLNDFLSKVNNTYFYKFMISSIGISEKQQILENQIEMLKKTFHNWNGKFTVIK